MIAGQKNVQVYDKARKGAFNVYLKKLIHAYSPLKIPIILALNIPDTAPTDKESRHSVAICGYRTTPLSKMLRKWSLSKVVSKVIGTLFQHKIIWQADAIEKLYVHDDQWGHLQEWNFPAKLKRIPVGIDIYR